MACSIAVAEAADKVCLLILYLLVALLPTYCFFLLFLFLFISFGVVAVCQVLARRLSLDQSNHVMERVADTMFSIRPLVLNNMP